MPRLPLRLLALLRRPKPLRSPPLSRPLTSNKPPPTSRLTRLESRLPASLRHYTIPLRNAPVSHITAFLLLHELTALLPLLALTALFHYTCWLPSSISDGEWMSAYTEKFGKYMRKKGWISSSDEDEDGEGGKWGSKLVVEVAAAYAVTKVLLPVRLGVSVWATPGFARGVVGPVMGWLGGRVLGSGTSRAFRR